MKTETLEEFLARGGTIKKVKRGGNFNEAPKFSPKRQMEHNLAKQKVRESLVKLRTKP